MDRPKCIGVCSTTSVAAEEICRGCGITDVEREGWGRMSHKHQLVASVICDYRLKNYEECLLAIRYQKLEEVEVIAYSFDWKPIAPNGKV